PSGATSPVKIGFLSWIPPFFCTRLGLDGSALVSTPDDVKTPATDLIMALATPRFGSCWYTIRQVMPAAKAEIAIGMKTAVRKATAHDTRSIRTANTSPTDTTSAGTTATHSRLFLTAVSRMSEVKISL